MIGLLRLDEFFEGRHFDRADIVLCVRWYLRFKLSFGDSVEMMAERGPSMAHTTIMLWVHHYAPEFERHWNRFAGPCGPSWSVDDISSSRITAGWSCGSARCMASSGSDPRRSPSPVSNCYAGSTRAKSISAGCASKAQMRPRCGTQCWQRNRKSALGHRRSCQRTLHQSLLG
jgi:hypothetical protein